MGLFQKNEKVRTGIKLLGFGSSGVGKTTFALSCALTGKGIAAIDSEDGMKFYRKNPNLKHILNTSSYDELEEALTEIEEELIDDIETLVIDSETKFADNLQLAYLNVVENRAKRKMQSTEDANLSPREYGKMKLINKRLQALKIKLASMGINVISICQEKDIKQKVGDNWVVVGYEPDTNNKSLNYDYDIILRFFTDKDPKTGEEVYKAEVKKDRTQTFKKGDIIINPNFDMWKVVYDEYINEKHESIVDFNKNFERDEKKIEDESQKLDKLVADFKKLIKQLDKSAQVQVQKFLKDSGIDNPLKTNDVEGLENTIEFMQTLL